jgi:hypothetical protein
VGNESPQKGDSWACPLEKGDFWMPPPKDGLLDVPPNFVCLLRLKKQKNKFKKEKIKKQIYKKNKNLNTINLLNNKF